MARPLSPQEEKILRKGRYRQSVSEFGEVRPYNVLRGVLNLGPMEQVSIAPILNGINVPGLSITFSSYSLKKYDAYWYPTSSSRMPANNDLNLYHFDIDLTNLKHCEMLTTHGTFFLRNSPHNMSAEAYVNMVKTNGKLLPFRVNVFFGLLTSPISTIF